MEQRILDLLKRRCTAAAHPVLLLDEAGTVLWQSKADLPASVLTQVTADCQARLDGTRYMQLGETRHRCVRYFDAQEGIWIVELLPYAEEIIRQDLDVMTSAVQGITSCCKELENLLNEEELYDAMEELNRILANSNRLYRAAYLQKELDRYRTGGCREDYFSVNVQMRTLFQKVRNILRVCAEVELEEETREVMLRGDADQFLIAMLSALVLCYRDKAHFQTVHLRVEQAGEQVRCSVSVKPKDTPLPPDVYGMNREDAQQYDAEMLMLQVFAEMHNGTWMMAEQAETGERTCQVSFTPTVAEGSMMLHSAKELSESRFFNKYELLLSRIRCQRFY